MNPYIIVSGQSSSTDNINAVKQIANTKARQQWVEVLTKSRSIVGRNETMVILNNRNASITFRFNVSAGNYDIYLRCVAPTSNTDTSTIRLDSFKTLKLDLKRRPASYFSKPVIVRLFAGTLLSDGAHTLTVGYKEPIGLLSLTLRKKRSNLRIVVPAINMLYQPERVVPQPAPVVVYDTTTQGPVIEAEYKPVETTTTAAPFYEISTEAPYYETTTSAAPFYETSTEAPYYETTTTAAPAPYYEVSTTSAPSYETTTTTTIPSSTGQPIAKHISKKKAKKGLSWWAILVIILVVLALVLLLIYFFRRRQTTTGMPPTPQQMEQTEGKLLRYIQSLPEQQRKWLASLQAALRKPAGQRTEQDNKRIDTILKCRDDKQKLQKILLQYFQNMSAQQRQSYGNTVAQLRTALYKPVGQRTVQDKQRIDTILQCRDDKQKTEKILLQYFQNMSGQQRNKFGNLIAEVQTGLRKLPAQRSTQQKRIIGKLLQCKDLQKQGANVLSTLVKERQNVQQTTPTGQQVQQENAIVNKLQQIDDKYKLNLIQKDWGIGDVDLSSQVSALKKDKDIYQFIKNFDPNSQQSQKQLPIIQTKLNQILKKDGGNLIGKILKGSLEKQKQSTAPPRVASFQKQPQKSNLEPRTLSPTTTNQKRPQIRRASSLQQQDDAPSAAAMAVLNQYYKRKQQTPTQQIQNNAKRPPALVRVASSLQQQQNPKDISNLKPDDYLITKRVVKPSTSQLQRVFQVAKLPQDGTMTNIRENIKKANQQIRTQTQRQNQY